MSFITQKNDDGVSKLPGDGLTLHIIVCFSTGDPLSSLKAPVVRVSQNNFHKDVVMSREVKSSDIKTEEWEHPPGDRNTHTHHLLLESWFLGKVAQRVAFIKRWSMSFNFKLKNTRNENLGFRAPFSFKINSVKLFSLRLKSGHIMGEKKQSYDVFRWNLPGLREDLNRESETGRPVTRCGRALSYLPCLVMIISVWCRWNFSQRGRLHR